MASQGGVECFDPRDLRLLRQALDDAWSHLANSVPKEYEAPVREAMSVAIFDMAKAGQRDPERIWCYAVKQGRIALFNMLAGAPASVCVPSSVGTMGQ